MTTRLTVLAQHHSYDVWIGGGLLAEVGPILRGLSVSPDARIFIITDETVARLGYARRVADTCTAAGWRVATAEVAPGDGSKSLAVVERLYNQLLDAEVRRDGVVIAVGGGAVGDLAGFVAATYLRGVRFVQVPTTLLAHDSSIGGKVGINLPRGKNLVGAFHPPLAVIYDVSTLATLPEREWQGGMAEVIKHAVIGDAALFDELEGDPLPEPPDLERLESLVTRAAAVKIRIVEADERESNIRMWLNLGHTVGHAVEQVSGYTLNHGEAVSIGLSVEAEIARARGWLPHDDFTRIRTVLQRHGLPIAPPPYSLDAIASVLSVDKKHRGTGWTFVLPRSIGKVEIVRDVSLDELRRAWKACGEEGGSR